MTSKDVPETAKVYVSLSGVVFEEEVAAAVFDDDDNEVVREEDAGRLLLFEDEDVVVFAVLLPLRVFLAALLLFKSKIICVKFCTQRSLSFSDAR